MPISALKKRTVYQYTLLLLSYIGVIVLLAFLWGKFEHNQLVASSDSKLLLAATALRHILPENFHDRTTDNSSISIIEELSARKKFNQFAAENQLKYIYTLIESNGSYYFTAPTVTDDEATQRERWYYYPYEEIPDAFKAALRTGTNATLSYSDEWGNFRSACIFETSPGGRPYLACADIETSAIDAQKYDYSFRSAFFALPLLIFLLPFSWIMRRTYKDHLTDLAKSHAQTRTHLNLLHNLIDRLPIGLMIWEKDNRISQINPAFSELTGYSLHDVATRNTWFHLAYPDRLTRTRALQFWANIRKGSRQNPEASIACKDGVRRICSLRGRQLNDGRTFMLISDITEQVASQESLRASEIRLRNILNVLDVGIVVVDTTDLRVRYVNPKMLAMTGRSMDELIGSHCKQYVCASCAPGCPLLDQGQPIENAEQKLKSASGEDIHILKSVIPAQLDGQSVLVEAFVDIGTQKKIEAQLVTAKASAEAASKAKSEFLAVISHEIRTPLNGIMGALQLIQAMEPEGLEEVVANALNSSRGLLTILKDVLDLSSMEVGALELVETPFQRADMIQPVLASLQSEAQRKGLVVECLLDPRLPEIFVGDAPRIRQIFFNLMGNAIKFTSHGTIRIEINMLPWKTEHGRGQIHFMVSDTGIGIPDAKHHTIFDPFTQLDMALNRKFEGAGIGLAIVQRLVRLMGGSLCLISEQGVGTEFHFSLSLGNACSWQT